MHPWTDTCPLTDRSRVYLESAERAARLAADCARKSAARWNLAGETVEGRRFRLRAAASAASAAELRAQVCKPGQDVRAASALAELLAPLALGAEALAPLNPAHGGALLARATYTLVAHPSRIGMVRGKRSRETARDPRGAHDTYTGQGVQGMRERGAWRAAERQEPGELLLERIASARLALDAERSPLRQVADARRARHNVERIGAWLESIRNAERARDFAKRAQSALARDSRQDRKAPLRAERAARIERELNSRLRALAAECGARLREARRALLAEYDSGKLGQASRRAIRARAALGLASLACLDDAKRGAPGTLASAPLRLDTSRLRRAIRARAARKARAEVWRQGLEAPLRQARRENLAKSAWEPVTNSARLARLASLESAAQAWRAELRASAEPADREEAIRQLARLAALRAEA